MTPVGHHFILELSDCPPELLDDPCRVTEIVRRASSHARLTLLGEVSHRFEPQGVTAVALLAESHLSLHTWPEHGYAAADLFTCGARDRAEQACHYLVQALRAGHYTLHVLRRGARDSGPVRVLQPVTAASRPGRPAAAR